MVENMVDRFRRQITGKSIVAYLILGALVLVFVLFDFKQGISGIGSVAQVNNAQISILDFQQEEQQIQQYYANMFGGAMDLSSQRQMLQGQAIENLVRQELVAQAAKEEGFQATDAEVRDMIVKDIPIFQDKGIFQRDRYSRFLEYNHWSPAQFETRVRKQIAMTRSRRFFETVSRLNRVEIDRIKDLKSHKVNVSFIRLNVNQLGKERKVTLAQAEQALQGNPEFLKKAEAEFKATKSEYDQREEVKAQHILLSIKDAQDSEQVSEALTKINEIKERLKKEDFGVVAKQVSQDPGSQSKGGDLGFFGRGRMAKEFEEAAFSLTPGQISEPVKTQYGYHLIKVNEKKPALEATWEDKKILVAQKLLGREQVESLVQKLEEGLKSKDDALIQGQIKALGVNWEETGAFDLSVDSIPKLTGASVAKAIFEASLSSPWVGRLVREGGDQYLLKIKEVKTELAAEDIQTENKAEDLLTQRRSAQIYESWVNAYRKVSKVTTNKKLFSQ